MDGQLNVEGLQGDIQNSVSLLLGEYGWMFLAGMAVLFFKTTIESVLAGLVVFLGNDYNNDDIIILDGRPGRIVRVSMWKTIFYLYTIKKGPEGKKFVSGGTKLVIENNEVIMTAQSVVYATIGLIKSNLLAP